MNFTKNDVKFIATLSGIILIEICVLILGNALHKDQKHSNLIPGTAIAQYHPGKIGHPDPKKTSTGSGDSSRFKV